MIFLLIGTLQGLRQVIDYGMRATHVASVGMWGAAVAGIGLLVCGPIGNGLAGFEGFVWGLVAAQLMSLVAVTILAARLLAISPFNLVPVHPASVTGLPDEPGANCA